MLFHCKTLTIHLEKSSKTHSIFTILSLNNLLTSICTHHFSDNHLLHILLSSNHLNGVVSEKAGAKNQAEFKA
jgi:hypothetical protein